MCVCVCVCVYVCVCVRACVVCVDNDFVDGQHQASSLVQNHICDVCILFIHTPIPKANSLTSTVIFLGEHKGMKPLSCSVCVCVCVCV